MRVWIYTVDLRDVVHDAGLTFEQKRDAIVERLRASRWHQVHVEKGDMLPELVDELAETKDGQAFDRVFGAIYDVADEDLAWIKAFSWVEASHG